MAKPKLSTRIRDAYHAFMHGPTLVKFEQPVVTVTRPDVKTIGAEVTLPLELIDLQGPEVTNTEARQDIAKLIGRELLNAGAIETRQEVDLRNGYLRYHGRARVVMPEKEDDGHGQE